MEEISIPAEKKWIDFVSKLTTTIDRSYIHIPAHFIKNKEIDLDKTYRIILIQVDQDEKKEEKKL
jgi:hypothetical protein